MGQKFKSVIAGVAFATALPGTGFAQLLAPPAATAEQAAGVGEEESRQKRGLTFLPGVRTSVTYSDNIDLAPKERRSSGGRLEVSPYIFGSVNNDLAQGQTYLSIRNFYQTGSVNSGSYTGRPDFRGNGTIALWEKWLFLQGSGFAYNISPFSFQPIAFDAAAVPTYNNRYQGFSVAPFIQGSLGTLAEYKGQYSLSRSEITGFSSVRTEQKVLGTLRSGAAFNTWGWAWNGEHSERKISTNSDKFNRNISTATLYYTPYADLKIGAAIRYEQIDTLFNKQGKDFGIGPGFSIDWAPSTRTSLNANIFQQYYGKTGLLGLSHRFNDRLAFNLSYNRSVLSGNDASFLNLNPNALFSVGGYAAQLSPIYRSSVSQTLFGSYGVPVGLGVLNDALILNNSLSAGLTYVLPSGSVSFTLGSSKRETLVSTFDPLLGGTGVTGSAIAANGTFLGLVNTNSALIAWEHKFDTRSKFTFFARYSDNDFPKLLRRVKNQTLQASYSTRLTSQTTASVGVRHSEQSASGFGLQGYDENSLFSTLDVRY